MGVLLLAPMGLTDKSQETQKSLGFVFKNRIIYMLVSLTTLNLTEVMICLVRARTGIKREHVNQDVGLPISATAPHEKKS